MKVVILAGGFGSRLGEETVLKPKPMVKVGEKPIIWYIMKHYSGYGFNEFIICTGYLSHVINEYFLGLKALSIDFTIDIASGRITFHENCLLDPWSVTLVNSGESTMTGGRLSSISKHVDSTFMFTYGDGLCDVNIFDLINSHHDSRKLASVTAVKPRSRFGSLILDSKNDAVTAFSEKPETQNDWINGGFFVLEPEVIQMVSSQDESFESSILTQLALNNQLNAFKHHGFWHSMDTLRDKAYLESLITGHNAPWITWN